MDQQAAKSTTSPLRSGHVAEAATSLRSRRQVVYDVWLMKGLKDNRRIASETTLKAAHEVITPEERKEYVYILKWTPAFPKPKHIWGCLCNRVHTHDMRDQVRRVLRG